MMDQINWRNLLVDGGLLIVVLGLISWLRPGWWQRVKAYCATLDDPKVPEFREDFRSLGVGLRDPNSEPK